MRYPINPPIVVTNPFRQPGYGVFGLHAGLDLRASVGTNLYAPANGVITERYIGSSGIKVLSMRIGAYEHRFLHLNDFNASVGQNVTEGQIIGHTGNTGNVLAHLHWDVRKAGTPWDRSINDYINPATLITQGGNNVADTANLSTARIMAETILGRDPAKVHTGAYDSDLNKWHVNTPLTNQYIMDRWQSGEAKAAANLRKTQANFYNTYKDKIAELSSRPTKDELAKLGEALKVEQAKVVEAEKALAEAEKNGGGISAEDSAAIKETNGLVKQLFDWLKNIFK